MKIPSPPTLILNVVPLVLPVWMNRTSLFIFVCNFTIVCRSIICLGSQAMKDIPIFQSFLQFPGIFAASSMWSFVTPKALMMSSSSYFTDFSFYLTFFLKFFFSQLLSQGQIVWKMIHQILQEWNEMIHVGEWFWSPSPYISIYYLTCYPVYCCCICCCCCNFDCFCIHFSCIY